MKLDFSEVEQCAPSTGSDCANRIPDDLVERKYGHLLLSCERVAFEINTYFGMYGKITMCPPFHVDAKIVAAVLAKTTVAPKAGGFPDDDNRLLGHLVDMRLPNLPDLDMQDVVSLRQNAEEFGRFLRSLKHALRNASQVPLDTYDRCDAERRAFQEEMDESRMRLEESLSKAKRHFGFSRASLWRLFCHTVSDVPRLLQFGSRVMAGCAKVNLSG
jgi:hypothetical protein